MKPRPVSISRRRFIRNAALSSLLLRSAERELAAAPSSPVVSSAVERPGVALVGCGGMGRADAASAARFGDVIAVCDVDSKRLDEAAGKFSSKGKHPAKYTDFRRLLERKDVDVIIQATPDHWHTLVNMAAARAGKDVYAEKPLTLTIDEGRRLVQQVQQSKTILQTGSQQRSSRYFRMACELVLNGRIGALKGIKVFLPAGPRKGPFKSTRVPRELDWDQWQGQAEATDYVRERCHGSFRYWFEYSGGTMSDWGAHHNDIARWALKDENPIHVEGRVLAEPIPGGYTAFSEYEAQLKYPSGVRQIIRSTVDDDRGGRPIRDEGQRHGIRFVGTDGWIWVTRGDIQGSKDDLVFDPLPERSIRLEVARDHMENFFQCVRTRKDPICSVEVGHRSASVCHLANIALQMGQPLSWDPGREIFVGEGSEEANGHLSRPMRKPYDYSFIG